MNSLQNALLYNAVFSGSTGLLMILFHQRLAQLFQVNGVGIFWIIGAALLYFAITLLVEMGKQRGLAVLWIITQDIVWVLGSLLILLFDPFSISLEGHYLIGGVSAVVLGMAINQAWQLMKLDEENVDGRKVIRYVREVKAPQKIVWNIISDISSYHEVAPNIDQVKILSGSEEGMVRACSHGNDSWTETCTLWEAGKRYSFEVDTTPPDYPFPFQFLKGTWEAKALSSATTKITMVFEFQYNRAYQKLLIHPLLKIRFKKIAEKLLDNWQNQIGYMPLNQL